MIQDIAPYTYCNDYINQQPSDNSVVLYFQEQLVMVGEENGEIKFPLYSEWKNQKVEFIYLFSIDDTTYYLANTNSKVLLAGYVMKNIQIFRTALPRHTAFAGITAFQLNNWYKENQFCGKCGSKMMRGAKERNLYCENCHHIQYPKISPAMIVAVTDGDKLLMSKYAQGEYRKYALLAGFTEVGETIEETVQREVMEEVGIKVKNIRYYKSQPWSFSGSLLLGFFAELDGSGTITIDEEELAEAVWIPRDEIQMEFDNFSLTNEMIIKFKNNK